MPRDAQLATMPCPVCACLANKIPGGQPMSSAIPSASGESKRFTDLKERRKLERQAKREPSRAKKAELRKEIKKLGGK